MVQEETIDLYNRNQIPEIDQWIYRHLVYSTCGHCKAVWKGKSFQSMMFYNCIPVYIFIKKYIKITCYITDNYLWEIINLNVKDKPKASRK